MGAPAHAAPPVVAVLVVHEPGDWFAESLASLAMQDYPNLRVVAFLSGSTESAIGDQIRTALPSALVRQVEANPGFGPVANQAMRVVEGTDGFFLFLHDDVALQRDAVTSLVEEAFRSNAAVVGPKLVEWDAPTVLQHVGLDADRTGRLVDVVDPGERDQEQHDAVRDTFALPSACLLVRNDIFRTLGGFSPSIPFFGEELEFCWRVHLLGARVLVNPSAVARHRGAFAARMFLPSADARAARHRVRTVLSCVSLSQMPVVVVRLLLQSLAELVIGVFSGSARNALVGLRAVAAIPVDLSAIVARRRTIAPFRRVPSREVTALQLRSTAQLAAFARHRRALREQQTSETPSLRPVATSGSRTTVLLALSLLALVIVGSRQLIWGEVSPVGQFVAFARDDVSMRDLVRQYLSGWSFGGFGAPTASPTALGALAIAGVVAVGRFSGLLTFVVVGSFF
ncbi:MAG: glycosyltransferase family 2 protein, partial [Actinobacteria bacterium]|nr:glycosyltransferase family 2 protein [Actinomycetota bacterium]